MSSFSKRSLCVVVYRNALWPQEPPSTFQFISIFQFSIHLTNAQTESRRNKWPQIRLSFGFFFRRQTHRCVAADDIYKASFMLWRLSHLIVGCPTPRIFTRPAEKKCVELITDTRFCKRAWSLDGTAYDHWLLNLATIVTKVAMQVILKQKRRASSNAADNSPKWAGHVRIRRWLNMSSGSRARPTTECICRQVTSASDDWLYMSSGSDGIPWFY